MGVLGLPGQGTSMVNRNEKLRRGAWNGGLECWAKGLGSHSLGSSSQSGQPGTQRVQQGTSELLEGERLGSGAPVGSSGPGPAPARKALISQDTRILLPQAVGSSEGRSVRASGRPSLGFRKLALAAREDELNSRGQVARQASAEVPWPPDLFFLGHQEVIVIMIATRHSGSRCPASQVPLHHRIRWVVWRRRNKWSAREQTRPNWDFQSAAVAEPGRTPRIWSTTGCPAPWAAQSRCRAAAVESDPAEPPASSAHLLFQLSPPHLAPTGLVEI